jgi:hypothetical protein
MSAQLLEAGIDQSADNEEEQRFGVSEQQQQKQPAGKGIEESSRIGFFKRRQHNNSGGNAKVRGRLGLFPFSHLPLAPYTILSYTVNPIFFPRALLGVPLIYRVTIRS